MRAKVIDHEAHAQARLRRHTSGIGLCHTRGAGPFEDATALAGQGNADAQYNLGVMYEDGRGVAYDYKEAVKWYRLAAAQGLARAQYRLGVMYDDGRGVPQDYVRAHMWLNFAAPLLSSEAESRRADTAAKMTPAEKARAQALTRACQISDYKSCGEPKSQQTATVTPSPPETTNTDRSREIRSAARSIPMQEQGGIYIVPVLINNTITLKFVVDSGASDVSIPADVVSTLIRAGTLENSDFLGSKTYILADGSKIPSQTFRIRSLRVGDRVLDNITGSIASAEGHLLLGQSFLRRFKSWSIDNTAHALVLE